MTHCFVPPLGGLGETYVLLRLIRKLVAVFILVIIKLLLLGVTAEALRANVDWKSAFLLEQGQFGPNFR